MDILHNIEIQISSVVMHDLTVYMHMLLYFPYQILCHKYDAHVASLFNTFHTCDFFGHTFCFEHFGFDI